MFSKARKGMKSPRIILATTERSVRDTTQGAPASLPKVVDAASVEHALAVVWRQVHPAFGSSGCSTGAVGLLGLDLRHPYDCSLLWLCHCPQSRKTLHVSSSCIECMSSPTCCQSWGALAQPATMEGALPAPSHAAKAGGCEHDGAPTRHGGNERARQLQDRALEVDAQRRGIHPRVPAVLERCRIVDLRRRWGAPTRSVGRWAGARCCQPTGAHNSSRAWVVSCGSNAWNADHRTKRPGHTGLGDEEQQQQRTSTCSPCWPAIARTASAQAATEAGSARSRCNTRSTTPCACCMPAAAAWPVSASAQEVQA